MLAIRAKTVLRETEGQETIFSPQKPFEVSLSDCLPCWQGSSSSRKIFFSGWVAVFSMGVDTPRSKETGILGSQRLLAKDRIASEKVEVFSPQAFIGSSIEGSSMPYRT